VQYLVDDRDVARDQALHRGAHPLLREAAHLEQPPLERFELLLKMSYYTFQLQSLRTTNLTKFRASRVFVVFTDQPNLPVT
jgi:hypothetical protein